MEELASALGCRIDDYCLYEDAGVSPARYCLLIESDKPLSVEKLDEYARIFDEKLGKANVEYGISREHAEISAPLVLLQQPQSHALWREYKIYKGASQNQVKLVRVLDSPQKEKFFLGMLEEGSRWEEVAKKA